MPESEAVSLVRATSDDAPLLGNLIELYTHDLSAIFPVQLDVDGRFGYEKLPLYWQEPASRYAFLIKHGSRIAGFALATRGLQPGNAPSDLDVAEFFVLRAHRGAGVGSRAAFALWDALPGRWVVRVLAANSPALEFWRGVVGRYARDAFAERVLEDSRGAWCVLTFTCGSGG
ncbi:MAG TPA: GNAT family N-acetyltransferase [Gammaproteobacteria bacterium]|nr:GNAT family N-acetyltransferase [Gammaproteobacteria bacterium]